MSGSIKTNDSELLVKLSEQQQETIAGGYGLAGIDVDYFFFQQTDVRSHADTSTKFDVAKARAKGSSSGRTGYEFSQTTLAFGSYPDSSSQSHMPLGGIIGGFLSLLFGFF